MYLKRLEISGFKSFANRTELAFVPGITAVVGPNGSGKSNVTDGIRWVLGEQSAKSLRGAKMEDVIFAGSQSRKPVGFCEVSITFENADRKLLLDYAEVTITRRVFRSGESEYLLNKQTCRLKDIHELFMDTGIGKEAYSLIGQGRIDDILSTKSEDRRAIFEEVAGIVKYKARKKTAEKKLADTEENLSRVHDLIHELDTQIAPLAEQAEQAKQWKQTKAELKQHEVSLYAHKIELLHQEWEQTSKQIEIVKEEQLALQSSYSLKEAKLEQLRYELHQKEITWEQIQQEMLTVSGSLEKVEGKQNVAAEQIKQLKTQQSSLNHRLQQIVSEQEQIQIELQSTKKQAQLKQQTLQEITRKLATLKAHATSMTVGDQDLTNLQAQLQQVTHQQIQYGQQAHYLKQQLVQLTDEQENWSEAIQKIAAKQQESKTHANLLSSKVAEVQEQLRSKEQALQKITIQLRDNQRQEQTWQQKLHKQEQSMARIRSQREFLQELQMTRDGFFRGVKSLLAARDQGTPQLLGIEGAVAELITVTPKYETAVETALGSAMQHLIVQDEQVARASITFLKAQKLGRATFLPIQSIKPRQIPAHELAKGKELALWWKVATQLVQTKPTYQQILDYLLGLVVVTGTIEDGNKIARALNRRYRIVTLDGDMVHPGGSMSGGSRKKVTTNLLGRGRQLELISQEWDEQQEDWQQMQAAYQSTKGLLEKLSQAQSDVYQQLEVHKQQIHERQSAIREQQIQQKNLQTQLDEARLHQQQITTKHTEMSDQLQVVQAESKKQQQQEINIKQQLVKQEQKLQEQTAVRQQDDQQITEYKVDLARLEQAHISLKQSMKRLTGEQQKQGQQRKEITQELSRVTQQLDTVQKQRTARSGQLDKLKAEKNQIQIKLLTQKEQREHDLQLRDSQEQEIRLMQKSLKKLEASLHEHEMHANRLDVELNHLLQKLAEEYELSFERAKERFPLQLAISQVEKQVRQLKRSLVQLGEVNIGAIEEYTRLAERLTFLQTQEKDLLQAKQTLYEMIDQIEQEMSKQFLTAFELIRNEFKQVFAQMFGGGEADLHLTDEQQILETGIEIIAQPPGKRPQYLSLLSGGERALTAIALLFAVLKIKPVPFCVLDEVDAALDEVNLTRYTQYMKKFSNQTQFIIITHRKQTMEGADVLYGITMEESGVSKLVSVQLAEWTKQEVAPTRAEEG